MTLDDKEQYIKELEQRLTDFKQKEQNDKLDRISEKLESMEDKISHSDKLDDNSFKDAENYPTPNDIIKDDKVREILLPNETPAYHDRISGKFFAGKYDKILFTDKRIIFYKKTGTFSKKINFEVIPIHNLKIQSYEEKGLISKKGILKIDIGLGKPLTWEDSPSKIQPIYQLFSRIGG